MLGIRVKHPGVVVIDRDKIYVEGFEFEPGSDKEPYEGPMCREAVALGILWAIGELQRELTSLIAAPGGHRSVSGLPDGVLTKSAGILIDQ